MHILYKVTYLPHLETEHPKYYIGSKYNYKGDYFGSVDSKQVYSYTNGKPLRDWWKEQKQYPESFLFEIIESFEEITPEELVIKERDLHIKLNVLSESYFNHSIATKGFCSKKRSEESKKHISNKTKKYWDSDAGKMKKQRLTERNKNCQSDWMKQKWQSPSEAMLNRIVHGRPKGSKDLTTRKSRSSIKQVCHSNVIYEDANKAAQIFGVHPVSIRRWCKNKINDWSYV